MDELVQMEQETLKHLTFCLRTLEKLILSERGKTCFHVCFQLDIMLLLSSYINTLKGVWRHKVELCFHLAGQMEEFLTQNPRKENNGAKLGG